MHFTLTCRRVFITDEIWDWHEMNKNGKQNVRQTKKTFKQRQQKQNSRQK